MQQYSEERAIFLFFFKITADFLQDVSCDVIREFLENEEEKFVLNKCNIMNRLLNSQCLH